MEFRQPVLEQFKKVGLDKDAHRKLRKLKIKLKKSMAQIIKDLINELYKKTFRQS